MKKLIALLLVLTVALSGCTIGGSGTTSIVGTGTQGVIIKTFSPSDTKVEPNVPVTLTLLVSNAGSQKATNVNANLMGLTDEWSISEGRSQFIGDLFGADTARGISQGEERAVMWMITGPEKNVELPYEATVRVTYTYTSEVDGMLKAVSSNYYQQKNVRSDITSQKTTGGPLTLTAKITSVAISGGTMPIRFEIQNSGGGRLYVGDSPSVENLDRLYVSVEGASCPRNDIRLVQGKSAVLYCTIDTGGIDTFKLVPFKLYTTYSYFVDSTTSITVLPKPPI